MEQRYLTAKEAAKFLRTSPGQLANLRMRGEGPPFVRLKRKCLYEIREIENWLNFRKIKTIET